MTPEEQQIAIAEACGWKKERVTQALADWVGPHGEIIGHGQLPPDYLKDLNWMHEAEETLKENQMKYYATWLLPKGCMHVNLQDFYCLHSTASQRAEAFLRTIGKWKDE